jgi:AAA family ATP:ADP antiporter
VSWLAIRKDERRDAWAAFSTLFVLIASHSLLETARDALFLERVPAARLPWVYLAIAALSLVAVRLQGWVGQRLRPRRALSLFTLLAGLVTLGFFALYRQLGAFAVYALYCWSGLLATLLLGHFWALVGGVFSITQAKRLYGLIGTGSVLGAITGSGLSSVLSRALPAEWLLCVASGGFLVAALLPRLFSGESLADAGPRAAPKLAETLAHVLKEPYGARVAISLFLASSCLTLADFVFKSAVANLVPKAELGAFLGAVYFAANVLSLFCQLGLVAWVLRRASLGTALALLPLLLFGAGLGVVIAFGLASVLAVKAADGALRHSLNRTATELLFLPFSDEARLRLKAFADVVAQRGGQAVSSLLILLLASLSASPRVTAVVLVVAAGVWALSAIALRGPYIELFRARLNAGRLAHLDGFPELDVASLETLTAALESDNDMEVLAALQILEREQKTRFIPALILHHPSEQVVVRALAILTRAGRKNLDKVLVRVVEHSSPLVRAASIAALSVLAPEAARLRERLDLESSPEVRATIVVNLIAAGEFSEAERAERVDELVRHGTPRTKLALAEAVRLRRAAGFVSALLELTKAKELEVQSAALGALNEVVSGAEVEAKDLDSLFQALISALIGERTRPLAEQLLAARGKQAFAELRARFEDTSTDPRLRWRLPHAMSEVNPLLASTELLAFISREKDGGVRYQAIRELERLRRRDPKLPIDERELASVMGDIASRAFRYLDRRLALERGAQADPRRKTPGHELLVSLLRDKERNACGRLFRLLGVLHATDDFRQIHQGLFATRELRATSLELIESIVREPFRSAVLALVDDGADEQRLERAGRFHRPQSLDYEPLVTQLTKSRSEPVREVAIFHAAELARAPNEGGRAA